MMIPEKEQNKISKHHEKVGDVIAKDVQDRVLDNTLGKDIRNQVKLNTVCKSCKY